LIRTSRLITALRPGLLAATLAITAALAAPSQALAQVASTGSGQAWPTKPVRVVVTLSPGSTSDILARVVAEA